MVEFNDLDEALETLRETEYSSTRKEVLEAIFRMDISPDDWVRVIEECQTGTEEEQLILDTVHEQINKKLEETSINDIEDLFNDVSSFCLIKTKESIIQKWLSLCTDYDEACELFNMLDLESWTNEEEELSNQLLEQARDKMFMLCNDVNEIVGTIDQESDEQILKQLFKRWSELCTDNDDAETSYERLSNESDENVHFMIEHWMKLCDTIDKAQGAYQIGYNSDDEDLKKAAVYKMHELYEKGVVAEPTSGGGIF